MKIQAKDVKVGMTITWGVNTITIEKIENGFQKNGKATVTFVGTNIRSYGRGVKNSTWLNYDFTMKAESWTTAK
jgi:translation elongation factor P/translation initiation factor 5A